MRTLYIFLLVLLVSACENDPTNRNPFLQEVRFRFDLNLNLPLYGSRLNTIGNPVYVDNASVGTRGAFVMRSSVGDQFVAWEASCPNHAPNSCSTMIIEGQTVICSCEDFEYSLFTGQLLNRPDDGGRYYDLLFYRAVLNGNIVTISN